MKRVNKTDRKVKLKMTRDFLPHILQPSNGAAAENSGGTLTKTLTKSITPLEEQIEVPEDDDNLSQEQIQP